jgi:hypothetical protein
VPSKEGFQRDHPSVTAQPLEQDGLLLSGLRMLAVRAKE